MNFILNDIIQNKGKIPRPPTCIISSFCHIERTMLRMFLILLVIFVSLSPAVQAQDSPSVPTETRFATIAKDEVFVRTGPAQQYPIKWVYKKQGLPVEIIRDYDTWRQIRDQDGTTGWVHHAMLSSDRGAIITATSGITALARPDAGAQPVVRLEHGVVVAIDACEGTWCRVHKSAFKGWVPRGSLWGIYPSEEIR
jgi:SH3-like domain-containing protein